jgi:N-acetylglucosamine kinase-like BadF-type ATPase
VKYILALDGGGTKTIGYLGDGKGRVLFKEKSGPSNYHSIGIEKAKDNLETLINQICRRACINVSDISLISVGFAGIDREKDKEAIRDIFRNMGIKCELLLNNDAKTALVGSLGTDVGVITICGTGSIALGMDEKGNLIRAGGWGHLISDEGSGYYLAVKAIEAVMKAYDHRIDNTLLTDKVLKALDMQSCEDIIGYIYDKERTKNHIAKIAPVVFQAANEKDKAALSIINDSIDNLVDITYTVIKRLNIKPERILVTYGGGIFENVESYRKEFLHRLKERAKNIEIVSPMFNGGIGAMILGWKHFNIEYDIDRLRLDLEDIS